MRRVGKTAFLALIAVCSLVVIPSSAAASVTVTFPSSNSTVVGSVGFIDSEQVGYFWSVDRGDLVSETFNGPGVVNIATLNVEVIENVLNNGAEVDWDLEINGRVVDSFVVPEGFFGPITRKAIFLPIKGPVYDVTLRVTNQVAGGEGSHTFAYDGPFGHSLRLEFSTCVLPGSVPCIIGK